MINVAPASMADLTPVLAAIPSGTPTERQVVVLPLGEFETDLTLEVSGKRFWSLIGDGTVLHFPTYGPRSNDGMYDRRHTRFDSVSDFYLGGLKIRGPHTPRSLDDPTRSKYDSTKAFQHGFVIARSQRVTVEDVEAYEIGGDGIYLNAVDDIQVLGLRVEFNGRQGIAGIDGNRWLFEKVNVVNSARNAIDFEPIAHRPGSTELRWITGVTVRDSDLKGGVTLHRVSDVTLEANRMRGGKILAVEANDLLAIRRYGIKILGNMWPDGWASNSANTGPIQFMSVNGAEVRGNKCHRDPADIKTAKAPFVEMRSVPATGHVTVRGNDTANFAQIFKWRDGVIPSPTVTTDIQTAASETSTPPPVELPVTINFPIRQQLSRFLTGTSITAQFRVAPVEGNLIFAAYSATTLATLAGWSKAVERQGSGVAAQLFYKRAVAGDQTVTVTSGVSAPLKLHVWEMPAALFPTGDPFDLAASNDSPLPVTTLSTGTTDTTSQSDELAIGLVAALGCKGDFRLTAWDGLIPLSDHETDGMMVGFELLSQVGEVSASATWTHASAPTSHKAVGLVATFKLAGPPTLRQPTPKRVSGGTYRAKLNLTGTVNTVATFPVTAGNRYLAFVGASKTGGIAADCLISPSHGTTWSLVESHFIGPGRRVHLFEAYPSADSSAVPITVVTPAVGVGLWFLVLEVGPPNTIRQVAVADEPSGDTFLEGSFTAMPAASSAVVGLLLHGQPEPELPDILPDIHLLYAAAKLADQGQWCSVQWYGGADQMLRWDWASVIHGLVVMAEVG